MMGDDSDDDKPLLFQFKNSKGSVQVKCSTRNGATNSSQNSMEKPMKNSKSSDDEDNGKPLQHTFSAKHSEKTSQKAATVVDVSHRTAEEQPLNGLVFKMGVRNLASIKVYTKRKKQLGNEVIDNVVAKKLKSPNCGASSKDDVDDDNYDVSLLSNSSANWKKHPAEVSAHRVVESQETCVTVSTSVVSKHMVECDEDDDGLKTGNGKEDDAAAVDDMNEAKDEKGEENETSEDDDVDDADSIRDDGAHVNDVDDADDAIDAHDVDDSSADDANASRDHADDSTGSSGHNGKTNDAEDSEDDADCGIHLGEQLDAEKKKLVGKGGYRMDDPRPLSSAMAHVRPRLLDVLSKPEARLNLVKEEEEDDNLPLSRLSHSKRNSVKLPANKDAIKESGNDINDGCGHFDTKIKCRDKKVAERSKLSGFVSKDNLQESVVKKENSIEDVPTGRIPCTNKKVSGVKEVVLEKVTDVRAGVSNESRRQQLLALSKSLEDTDSEEEEEEEAEEEEEDDREEEEEEEAEEEQEEDEEEDDDEDYNGSVAAKRPAVDKAKGGSTAKMPRPSTSSKSKSSVQSKTRTPISSSKSVKKIVVADYDDYEEESEEEDEEWEEEEDDEDYSTSQAKKRKKTAATKRQTASPMSAEKAGGSKKGKQKEDVKEKQPRKKAKKLKDVPGAGEGQKWTSLEHNGVMFPPFYQPHGIRMLYEGKPVDLTPEQEEVATMFAVMKETDYVLKPKFLANFWNDWEKLLGPNHVVQKLEGCDFTPIYEWHLAEKEKKQKLTTEEKKAIKEEKLKLEEKYMWAVVDGVKEKVGNFRVEPPALFRGRGEHPKMGKLKRRIYPEDIVINIGADSPVPECPLPGHSWKEVRHDDTVTWLAYWNDPINTKEQKYVFLSPSSTLKGQSDKEKYEKARVLKDYISDIRKTYTENFASSDPTTRQIAVATYLIDQLALRAGNEKDDDEADTVGCCSLKVEHVSLVPPSSVEFDFLGKDSIRYLNTVEVVKPVYEAIGDFKNGKTKGMDLFDKLDTTKLNAHLKNIMPQLTAKVFRTYNASITLDNLLVTTKGQLTPEKIAAYQLANKEVAILCNHQRSVSKSHGTQMEKLEGKLAELNDLLDELQKDLEMAKKGKLPGKDADGNPKKSQNPDVLEKRILQTKHKMDRMKLDMKTKEDLKTVALGTSKINYMDPRITVAWCKQHEVPIEKIFNKSLLAKFAWAMDADMSFRF